MTSGAEPMPANRDEADRGGTGVAARAPALRRDARRARNVRAGLLLAAVAVFFFVLIVLKFGWYGR
jgi:hypothetical protein